MKNNSSGFDIGASSGASSSRLKQTNASGLTPKTHGSTANPKGNVGHGKTLRAPDGLGPVTGPGVTPRNAKGC